MIEALSTSESHEPVRQGREEKFRSCPQNYLSKGENGLFGLLKCKIWDKVVLAKIEKVSFLFFLSLSFFHPESFQSRKSHNSRLCVSWVWGMKKGPKSLFFRAARRAKSAEGSRRRENFFLEKFVLGNSSAKESYVPGLFDW